MYVLRSSCPPNDAKHNIITFLHVTRTVICAQLYINRSNPNLNLV